MSKIVIDIDEDYYKIIQKNGGNNYLEDAVLNGIPHWQEKIITTDELNKQVDKIIKTM